MNLAKTKSIFVKILLGCLIAAAVIAVGAVLVGKFNDILDKSLFTLLVVAAHSLISLGFINNNEKQDTFENLSFFTNATFAIIVLSFATAILGIWGIVPGSVIGHLYELYFVLLFAILHGEVLAKALGKQASVDKLVYANFCFMVIVVCMFIPAIFTSFDDTLGSFYYRLLAATGIVDATLTLMVIILHRLYIQKHPKINDGVFAVPQVGLNGQPLPVSTHPKRHINIFVAILAGFVAVQLLTGLVALVIFTLASR